MQRASQFLHFPICKRIIKVALSTKFQTEIHQSITSQIVPSIVKTSRKPGDINFSVTSENKNLATIQQELLLSTFVFSHIKPDQEEWTTLITKLLEKKPGEINENNIDYKIVGSCVPLKNLDLARSYIDFIKSKKKLDGAIVCEFLKVCYCSQSSLTSRDFKRIVRFTEFLKQKYTMIDSYIGEGIIKGLLLQNKIDESFEIFDQIKKTESVNHETYSTLILYLLENRRIDLAKKLMREMVKLYELPDLICFKLIDISKNDRSQLDVLLLTFREFDYKPKEVICNYLIQVYGQLPDPNKLIGKYGTISKSGHCSVCESHLDQIHLSNEDYENLKNIVINRILIGQDIFKNTMPYELEKFFHLMELYAPFDIIIDGLNVAYVTDKTGSTITYVKVIEDTLKLFAKWNCKMIFIGKWHMRKWPGLLDLIRQYDAKYFFVEDISTDDPYILGATLYSGAKARFVTRDTMKNEELKLSNTKEAALFHRWRQSHNIRLKYVHSTKKITIQEPIKYDIVIQPTKTGGWHIPCFAKRTELASSDIFIEKWLCLHSTNVT